MATALLLCVMALMTRAYGQACGGTFPASSGTISSPSYPSSYPNNQHCTYQITGPTGSRVNFKFFAFKLANKNSGCTRDRVEIRDGCFVGAPLIGKFCGFIRPRAVTSTSTCLSLTFVSDASGTGLGFLGIYTIIS